MDKSFAWFLAISGALLTILGAAGLVYTGLAGLAGTGFLMAIGVSFFAVGRARIKEPARNDAARAAALDAPRPVPVSPLPPETLADLRGPLRACARCGSLDTHPARIQDGAYAGGGQLLGKTVCERCHHQGLAVEFDEPGEYNAFLEELASGGVPP